nr:hypothetical protein 6 [bacterium]
MNDNISVGYAGEQWQIPREIYQSGKAKQHIEQLIAQREAEAAAERKAQSAEVAEALAMRNELAQLRQQLSELQTANELKDRQIKQLETLGSDTASSAMLLMQANQACDDNRRKLQEEMATLARFRETQLADVECLSSELRKQSRANDEEREAARQRGREYLAYRAAGGEAIPEIERQALPLNTEQEQP